MIFTVAIISPATTGLKAGSVAKVIASSTRLSRSTASLSTTRTPGACANRLARPVKARSTCTPSPATALAISAAATSSETSPGSSRATTMSLMPAASQRRDFGGADQRALLEHQRALPDGVHCSRAERILGATAPNFMTPPCTIGAARRSASSRSRSVICAMIATAISAGDTAPISSPIGAWMRGEIGVGHALLLEPLNAARMGFPRAERADIETVARQRMQQRRIVDLRIMGERDEGGVTVDIERRQRGVRPLGDRPSRRGSAPAKQMRCADRRWSRHSRAAFRSAPAPG